MDRRAALALLVRLLQRARQPDRLLGLLGQLLARELGQRLERHLGQPAAQLGRVGMAVDDGVSEAALFEDGGDDEAPSAIINR